MSKWVTSCVLAVFVGLIMLDSNRAALAADDCLVGPNRPPAPGGHWYYHLDRANDRKCWYLVEPAARTPTADAMQPAPAPSPQPVAQPAAQPGFGSFFSSLSTGFPGSANGTQPVAPDARSAQVAPADDRNADTAPARNLQPARRPATLAALAPKPHQPTRPRPPAGHAAAPPDQAERDALFQEFLRWREQRQ